MQLLQKYTLLHAGPATRRYTPEKLLLSSLLSLAINIFFMVYHQKYKNCSTLSLLLFSFLFQHFHVLISGFPHVTVDLIALSYHTDLKYLDNLAQKGPNFYFHYHCCCNFRPFSKCESNTPPPSKFFKLKVEFLKVTSAQCIFWPIFVRFRIKLKIELFKTPIDIPYYKADGVTKINKKKI
jgi:hypothetical protein